MSFTFMAGPVIIAVALKKSAKTNEKRKQDKVNIAINFANVLSFAQFIVFSAVFFSNGSSKSLIYIVPTNKKPGLPWADRVYSLI